MGRLFRTLAYTRARKKLPAIQEPPHPPILPDFGTTVDATLPTGPLHAEGLSVRQIATEMGISSATAHRIVKGD